MRAELDAIRSAAPSDAAALAHLHASAFDRPWPESDFRDHIARDHVFVDADTRSLLVVRETASQAEILTLAVHPAVRRQGYARALIRHALPYLDVDVLFLEVAEDNASARALYTALGFEAFGRRPAYYRRGASRVAALTMQLRL